MKEFNLTPAQWHDLSNMDKKILHCHRIMEGHYLDQMQEARAREAEREAERRKFVSRLPKQARRGR